MAVRGRDFDHHEYRFYGRHGFIGKAPCRNTVKKLTPESVWARANVCHSDSWRYCILVDGKDQILDRMTFGIAWTHMCRNIYKKITITPSKLPHVGGAIY